MADIRNGTRASGGPVKKGARITIHDLTYKVKLKTPGKMFDTFNKPILINVSGLFEQGMNAVLGPTGSGKSSLLDVIAGRKDPAGLSHGTLLVDGKKQPKNFKVMNGYVVQDDVIAGTLTVRENLAFSANLRLPNSYSVKQREDRVESVIHELGLEKCANTRVGNEFLRGVSGGERKRTSIGMELVIEPPVLFLDEPTTGLDASTAYSVMSLLHRLSRGGRTIIYSIHQPRFTIYAKFDRLMLLSEGRQVYHGPAQEALQYLGTLGYVCEPHNNPSDFFLDVLLGDTKPYPLDEAGQPIIDVKSGKGGDLLPVGDGPYGHGDVEMGHNMEHEDRYKQFQALAVKMEDNFKKSEWYTRMHDEIDPIYKEYKERVSSGTEEAREVGEYATTFFSQVHTLSGRALKNLVRNPQTMGMQTILSVVMSTLAGIIFLQLDKSIQSGIQNRAGAIFFISMNMVFSCVSAVVIFIAERIIFLHESLSGYYRVSSYFLSEILFDLIPLRIVPASLYTVIAYFMIGFKLTAENYFIFYITAIMLTFVAVSISFFASCLSQHHAVANLIAIMIIVPMMVFGGLLVNIDTLGSWLQWLQYLSMFRYAMRAFYINEFVDMKFCPTDNSTGDEDCNNPDLGNDYLKRQGISYEEDMDLWANHLGLLAMTFFFLLLSYTLLRSIKKYK